MRTVLFLKDWSFPVKSLQVIIYFFLVMFFPDQVHSQEDYFKLSAQYRLRPEVRRGYRNLSADTSKVAFFVGQRARLVVDFKKGIVASKISIQDARTWGDEEMRKDLAGLQVNELWIELNFKNRVSMKLGRQEIVYDDHRIFGNLDWATLSNSHDALLLKYRNKDNSFNIHIGGAFNQLGEAIFGTKYTLNHYKYLGFGYASKELANGAHKLSGLLVIHGLNSTDTLDKKSKASFLVGPLYNLKLNGGSLILGAYFQGGKTASNKNMTAFMLNTYGSYTYKFFTAGVGLDFLSGNHDKTNANADMNFNTLFGTNHKFYGHMDYFLSIPVDAKGRGLLNPYLRLGFDYGKEKQFKTTLDVHYFLLANENNLNVGKETKRPLGAELDMYFSYKINPYIHLLTGYSSLIPTVNMERLKGGSYKAYQGWFFVQLTVSPTIFMHEFKK